jgi:hypothetical protein
MSDAKLGTSPATVDERRALDAEEWQLADMTRPPGVERHSDDDLAALVSRLRERRNRARELANRQAREARAKAAPAGAAAAKSDAGMRSKHDYLTEALDRATAEQDRRATAGSGESQADLSRKALDLKDSGAKPNAMAEDGRALHPKDPDASAGKADMADTARNVAPSGALDHAGELPSRERSRTRY